MLYHTNVTDEGIRKQAEAMVSSGLRDAGYRYVIVDDGWQGARDDAGELHSSPAFPDMKALGDFLHQRGLKFGIYSSPGEKTCGGHAGSLGHEDQDARIFAAWGVDYLKYDLCSRGNEIAAITHDDPGPTAQLAAESYLRMRQALARTGRPIVLSISQHGLDSVWNWAPGAGAQLWRTTEDIQANYERISNIGFSQAGLSSFAGPGHWNDPDLLVVGVGTISEDEAKSQLSLWALLAAPLIASNDLAEMPATTRDLLANKEVIAIDQDPAGMQGDRVLARGLIEIWKRRLADGSVAIGAFNRDTPYRGLGQATFALDLRQLTSFSIGAIRDVWSHQDLPIRDRMEVTIPPHGVVLLRISPTARSLRYSQRLHSPLLSSPCAAERASNR